MEQVNCIPVEILLVEDNEDDAFLTCQALKKAKLRNSVVTVSDGVEAMAYLRKEGSYASASRPDIVLLDLNLPRKDGYQVLSEIKEDPSLKTIPVIILTTSKADEDVIKSYSRHANCFISKAAKMEDFERAIQSLEDFWFLIVRLPPKVQ